MLVTNYSQLKLGTDHEHERTLIRGEIELVVLPLPRIIASIHQTRSVIYITFIDTHRSQFSIEKKNDNVTVIPSYIQEKKHMQKRVSRSRVYIDAEVACNLSEFFGLHAVLYSSSGSPSGLAAATTICLGIYCAQSRQRAFRREINARHISPELVLYSSPRGLLFLYIPSEPRLGRFLCLSRLDCSSSRSIWGLQGEKGCLPSAGGQSE